MKPDCNKVTLPWSPFIKIPQREANQLAKCEDWVIHAYSRVEWNGNVGDVYAVPG